MQNAKRCGCSFQQSNSCYAGERIRVNAASSCGKDNYRCQESRHPKPCASRTCSSRPCAPKPCAPRRNCTDSNNRNNRCGNDNHACYQPWDYYDYDMCGYDMYDDFDSCYGNGNGWNWRRFDNGCGCVNRGRGNRSCMQNQRDCECEEEKTCEEKNNRCDCE